MGVTGIFVCVCLHSHSSCMVVKTLCFIVLNRRDIPSLPDRFHFSLHNLSTIVGTFQVCDRGRDGAFNLHRYVVEKGERRPS